MTTRAADDTSSGDETLWVATPGFSLHLAPMDAFVEIPFVDGSPYRSIEVQRLTIADRRTVIVARHRPTGELDVYLPPGTQLDEAWFHRDPFLAHMAFGSIQVGQFRVARCEITDRSVDVEVDFDDQDGVATQVIVQHRFRRSPAPWFVPAVPFQTRPSSLRFMLAGQLRLLPRRTDRLEASVDGRRLRPRPFVLPSAVALHHRARVGGDVFGVGLNRSGSLAVGMDDVATSGSVKVTRGTTWFDFRMISAGREGERGSIEVLSSVGPVATGRWARTQLDDATCQVTLDHVVQDWSPGLSHPLRLFLRAVRRFRRRAEDWCWTGCHRMDADGSISASGRWSIGPDDEEQQRSR